MRFRTLCLFNCCVRVPILVERTPACTLVAHFNQHPTNAHSVRTKGSRLDAKASHQNTVTNLPPTHDSNGATITRWLTSHQNTTPERCSLFKARHEHTVAKLPPTPHSRQTFHSSRSMNYSWTMRKLKHRYIWQFAIPYEIDFEHLLYYVVVRDVLYQSGHKATCVALMVNTHVPWVF